MAFIYKWKKLSPEGRRKWAQKHRGIVVGKVFRIVVHSFDLSDEQWKELVKKKVNIAKKQGLIKKIDGFYDIRLKAFSRPIWKGYITDWGFD